MKLIRLKITDPNGFRSLSCGFEHHFRNARTLSEELESSDGFAPFVCAGPNGSGKSNLLEVLAAIFYQLEVLRVRRSYLPEVLQSMESDFSPVAFELDYLIRVPQEYQHTDSPTWAEVSVWKKSGESVRFFWENQSSFKTDTSEVFEGGYADILLPQYVLGYSSGENEILSLPFFKVRFVQYDEYWNALTAQLPYPGHPEARLAYLDNSFSQAILLCNLLFQNDEVLQTFREDIGIEELKEFRIILRSSIPLQPEQLIAFASEDENQHQSLDDIVKSNPALKSEEDDQGITRYKLNLLQLLKEDEENGKNSSRILNALKRCATLSYVDETTDTLILDYWVNDATKQAFRENFDDSPLALFQAFQVLLTLNLFPVNDTLKAALYTSNSHYVSETVPTLASDQRIMRFKNFYFTKQGLEKPMLLKELSDGEHQLLHSLGLCLLFRNTNSLFLLDEPETHFNPDWRANFISRLRECLPGNGDYAQEMLITTHTPFLISDSTADKVLVFKKNKTSGHVSISNPDYNTLGASINLITLQTFNKQETIGHRANQTLIDLLADPEAQHDPHALAKRIMETLGDSIERTFAVQSLLAQHIHLNVNKESD